MYKEADKINQLIKAARRIVILQADNPDADSLGSALALEHILADMAKETYLYCAIDMPGYLRYMPGWDRLQKELPNQFDTSIVVDASTMTLFDRLINAGEQGQMTKKPCVVLDHHQTVDQPLPFATITLNDHHRASTGELIYLLAKQLKWPVSTAAKELLMSSILGDTQGLTNNLATATTYTIMADLVESGVDRPTLEESRRAFSKMPPEIYAYKAGLIKRTEFSVSGQLAHVTIPQPEINQFSPLYNPAPLIQGDMLQVTNVRVAVVFKQYADGRITGAIRCNPGAGIAAELAEHLGGGGHAFASGFKVTDGRVLEAVKADCLDFAAGLLTKINTPNK